MKATTIPMICCTALAVMLAAGFIEWSSVRYHVSLANAGLLDRASPKTPTVTPAPPVAVPAVVASTPPQIVTPVAAADGSQKQFFELLKEVRDLKIQNLRLENQIGETNRDLINLNFRVDTHSSEFRPLPITEPLETLKTGNELKSLDELRFSDEATSEDSSVLPPRAEPVFLPDEEPPN